MIVKEIKFIISQLSELVTDATNINHIATTRDHFYFVSYDSFFKEEMSIRVDRYSGRIATTVNRYEGFMWWDIEKRIKMGGIKIGS